MTVSPSGPVAAKSGSSCSALPVSGAPVSSLRPTASSRSVRPSRSQVSMFMLIRRTTRVVLSRSHAGPSGTQTAESIGTPGRGLAVPSS